MGWFWYYGLSVDYITFPGQWLPCKHLGKSGGGAPTGTRSTPWQLDVGHHAIYPHGFSAASLKSRRHTLALALKFACAAPFWGQPTSGKVSRVEAVFPYMFLQFQVMWMFTPTWQMWWSGCGWCGYLVELRVISFLWIWLPHHTSPDTTSCAIYTPKPQAISGRPWFGDCFTLYYTTPCRLQRALPVTVHFQAHHWYRSRKRVGLSTDPWMTPDSSSHGSDSDPSTATLCVRQDKKQMIYSPVVSFTPIILSLYICLLRFTTSKALLKSSRIASTAFPLPRGQDKSLISPVSCYCVS